MAGGGDMEVQLHESGGEYEAVPPLADGARSEEGRRGERGDDAVDESLRKSAPDSAVHPWSGGDGRMINGGECVGNRYGYGSVEIRLHFFY